MTERKVLNYFKTLSYKEQRKLLTSLSASMKEPPFYITFSLTPEGCSRMGMVVLYCKKREIVYIPQKVNETKVRFMFSSHVIRNEVLIGAMTTK
ncbi:MAG: hypothetical protein ACTSQA_00530 [Candidatus Heimdallarchaeaceae archaeon]